MQPIPSLAEFAINSKQVSGQGVSAALFRLPSLKSLSVSYSDWTDEDLQLLPGSNTLKKLTIKGSRITRDGLESLASRYPASRIASETVTIEPKTVTSSNWTLSFDGVDDYVEIKGLTLPSAAGEEFTIEGWVRLDELHPQYDMFLAVDDFVTLFRDPPEKDGGRWRAQIGSAATGQKIAPFGAEPPRAGVWTHIAVQWSEGGKFQFYINGRPSGGFLTVPAPLLKLKAWDNTLIGCFQGGPGSLVRGQFLKGQIDEIRISSVGRYSISESFTPQRRFEADDNTLALYHFDEGQKDVLKDSSANGHDGKLHGPSWVTSGITSELQDRPEPTPRTAQ